MKKLPYKAGLRLEGFIVGMGGFMAFVNGIDGSWWWWVLSAILLRRAWEIRVELG